MFFFYFFKKFIKIILYNSFILCGAKLYTSIQNKISIYDNSKGAQGLSVLLYIIASSQLIQFHQDNIGDSGTIVTPFMQDGTYPPRNFATLGPSELQPPFTGIYNQKI